MVSRIDKQTIVSEFDAYWVLYTSGLVLNENS